MLSRAKNHYGSHFITKTFTLEAVEKMLTRRFVKREHYTYCRKNVS